jgi:hypothetical protein
MENFANQQRPTKKRIFLGRKTEDIMGCGKAHGDSCFLK